jgi:hypothetical protein
MKFHCYAPAHRPAALGVKKAPIRIVRGKDEGFLTAQRTEGYSSSHRSMSGHGGHRQHADIIYKSDIEGHTADWNKDMFETADIYRVDMCWALVAEEPHRSTILYLEHCPLKANVSCLIFPPHSGKMSSAQPLSGLDSPSQGSRVQLTGMPSYRSPPSLPPFKITIRKATRAHPALATFSLYLPWLSITIEPAVVRHQSPLS